MRKHREHNPDPKLGKPFYTAIAAEPKSIEGFFRSDGGAGIDFRIVSIFGNNQEFAAVTRRTQKAGDLAVRYTATLNEPLEERDDGTTTSNKLTIHDKTPIDPAVVSAMFQD